MTVDEFDLEFDLLYNNLASDQAPGLTQLEKSEILTEAQEFVVKELYNGTLNGESFEKTEEIAEYLNTLVDQVDYTTANIVENNNHIVEGSTLFILPANLWFITYESAYINSDRACEGNKSFALVVPTTQDEFYKVYNNPFRGPSRHRVVRLLQDNKVELVSKTPIINYKMRYMKKPHAIVLKGIEVDNLSPYSEHKENGYTSELPDSIHRAILLRAVQIAKSVWRS